MSIILIAMMKKCLFKDMTNSYCISTPQSAMGGKPKVTDLLLEAVRHASMREHDKVDKQLDIVLEKHSECLKILFHQECVEQERLIKIIKGGLNGIRDILKTVSLMK